MEYLANSSNSLSDFEFKYIPKSQFEKVVREVESERRSRTKNKGMWGDFCTISSELDGDDFIKNSYVKKSSSMERITTPNEVYNAMKSNQIKMPSTAAPLFGPPRKYDTNSLKKKQTSKASLTPIERPPGRHDVRSKDSHNSSIHIVEEVNVATIQQNHQALNDKIQVAPQITTNDDVNDEKSSCIECSSDNDETLYSEMLDLCNEIENLNEVDGNGMKTHSSCKSDKTESREMQNLICEPYGTYIDDDLDFLDEEDCESISNDESRGKKNKLQASPVHVLRTEDFSHKSTDSKSTKNPTETNQMSKTESRTSSSGKSSVKNGNLTRENVNANEKSNNSNDKVTKRPKSQESSASLKELSVLRQTSGQQEKICEYLGHIHEIIDNPPELDDIADLNKRQRRAAEFTNRFARNHLYQIGRSAEELRLMPDNPIDVVTKVNSLFQIIMQAVQTYHKNIEMFIYNKNPDKLLVLVDFIINASKICFDRKVFDKNDALVMRMLRKCGEIRDFLVENEDSKAIFFGMPRKKNVETDKSNVYGRKKVAGGRKLKNSWTVVNDIHGKLKNPYDVYGGMKEPPRKQRTRQNSQVFSRSTNRSSRNQRELIQKINFDESKKPYEEYAMEQNPKSPYAEPISPKSKSKPTSTISSNIRPVKSIYVRDTQQKTLKKSTSDVSTFMQKEMEEENISEKQLDDGNVSEIMKMIQNITKEKFEEMLAPVIAQLVPKNEEIKSRVTADVEPLKKKPMEVPKSAGSTETIQRISHNVQYLFVKTLNDDQEDDVDEVPKAMEPLEPPSMSKAVGVNDVKITQKPPILACNIDSGDDVDDDFDHKKMSIEELRELALKERIATVEKMSKNPLYSNEHIREPWKLFSDISDQILDEMLASVIKELDFNDKDVVEHFLKSELAY